ncbi:NAD(P)-dependent oxidoreductase [Spiroplasma endosymbiont of Labia minor]|uniref:NAD(P)-dependent oxidoreductase n=1 Tax=Spiroplasma endosymbiont of Labia minor TaxID=3066305 RepID=UPI0030D44218
MKVLVLGATGKLGKMIVANLLDAKDDVYVLVRNVDEAKNTLQNNNIKYISGDAKNLNDIVNALSGIDVFVSTFGTSSETKLINVTKNIIDALLKTNVRGVIVSGAASLYLDETKTSRLVDNLSQVPEEFVGVMKGHAKALEMYNNVDGIKVSIFSPALDFEYPGLLTKKYGIGKDVVIYNTNNQSIVSYLDGAWELTNEIHNPKHIGERWTIGYTK